MKGDILGEEIDVEMPEKLMNGSKITKVSSSKKSRR